MATSSHSLVSCGEKCKEIAPFQMPPSWPVPPKLKEYNPTAEEHKLPDHAFIILEGSRRIGKSVFAYWLLYFYRKMFDLAIVMSETAHNGFWQKVVGNRWVHQGYNPLLIMKLVTDQAAQVEEEQKKKGFKARRVLLILDDIIGDKRHIHDDEELNRLAVQARHMRITVVLTTQDAKAINPTLRNNADMAVIFQQKNFRAKEAIYHDFLNIFEKKQEAIELLTANTKGHDCIVCEQWKLGQNPTELYFHVSEETTYDKEKDKPTVPDYQLGCKEQKKLAKTPEGKKPLFSGKV